MRSRDSARVAIRSATRSWHDRVDPVFSRFDLAERASYGRFLLAQAAAHVPIEEMLTRAGVQSVIVDWPQRLRAPLLRADLTALGLVMPAPGEVGDLAEPAALLGAAYVLEGSRLGGRLLQRSVPPQLPSSFLGASDSAAWRRFLILLDERLQDNQEREIAVDAAIGAFAVFERSGRRYLDSTEE